MIHPPSFSRARLAIFSRSTFRSSTLAAILIALCIPDHLPAAEVGAMALVFGWPDGTNNFGNYTKASGGTLSPAAAGNGWKSYGSASFHSLAASGSASANGTASSGSVGYVGGRAYWFDQIVISSPTVPNGTQGRALFTLYFDGKLAISEPQTGQALQSYSGGISYRVAATTDGADGVADLNVGEQALERIDVFSSYKETIGGNFRNQPRQHAVLFRFGEPIDFTISLESYSYIPRGGRPAFVQADVRCKGWNGFHEIHLPADVHVPGGTPVTNATITSQTAFNYANPGSATYSRWASLYQLNAASMNGDANGNGLSNLLEYALGRNPLEPNPASVIVPQLLDNNGSRHLSFNFTRPRLGGRPGDIVYQPKRSTALDSWSDTGMETTASPTAPDSDTETVTVRSTQAVGAESREFLQLEITGP